MSADQQTERKPKASLFMVLFGLCGLGVAAYALTDGVIWQVVDVRWAIAAIALFIGLALLGNSLRPRR
ncbi:hypothetical protein [Crossiella cryophila]|uniref:Putative membrane protein n=1 Tax=Crossiella cryophila TaxID=43355 RepID=A0A7W7C485_9PSEU|nr:hypothetical protein [Crossiella cryophila]MBB4674245.1 putative membrane protein [Crossiella cryophila]